MNLIQMLDFPNLGDERGRLVSLESNRLIPFEVKRVYYIFDTHKQVSRGFHAHKKLKQLAIAINGSCSFMLDDGANKEHILLSSPKQGLLIEDMVWHEMYNFSDDCVLLVLANDFYDESDYIRDYDNFIRIVNNA